MQSILFRSWAPAKSPKGRRGQAWMCVKASSDPDPAAVCSPFSCPEKV